MFLILKCVATYKTGAGADPKFYERPEPEQDPEY